MIIARRDRIATEKRLTIYTKHKNMRNDKKMKSKSLDENTGTK